MPHLLEAAATVLPPLLYMLPKLLGSATKFGTVATAEAPGVLPFALTVLLPAPLLNSSVSSQTAKVLTALIIYVTA